jgi:DNA polymerase III alpha subunit (gram-positive type)
MDELTEPTVEQPKELVVLAQQSGLPATQAQAVLTEFTAFFTQAAEWEVKTRDLIITDASQTKEMGMAREGRLQLKEIRVNAEKTRKRLKEDILVKGRFIDAIYNLIEGVTQPIEKALLEKEKFVERQEEARRAAITADRVARITQYGEIYAQAFDISLLSDEAFEIALANAKLAFEARAAAEAKAAEDAAKAEAEAAAERERIAEENIRLKAEAEKAEAERKEREAAIEAERKEREAERAAVAEVMRKAQEAEAAARKELQEKLDAEAKAKADEARRVEAERIAKAEAGRKAAAAGDREKVLSYITSLDSHVVPEVKSPEAKAIIAALIQQIAASKALASTKL